MKNSPILIADIGGTNARFALVDNSQQSFHNTQTLQAVDFKTLTDAIDSYLSTQNISQVNTISLAVAAPIVKETAVFPNSHWQIDCADLRGRYNTPNAHLLNDWESIAYSLGTLTEKDILAIGGQWQSLGIEEQDSNYTLAAIGPGSGLGTSGLIRQDGQLIPIIAEGGHAAFAPENELQTEVLHYLHRKFNGRVSKERVLSGPGLVNTYEALCEINNKDNAGLNAADISNAAVNKNDITCQETLAMFFEILGQVAGDTALSLGAYHGIFIGGGICQRYPEQLAASNFRKGFENKGRHSHLMQNIPTWLITHPNPGLLGASVFAKAKFVA